MSSAQLSSLVRTIRKIVARPAALELTDRQLLEQFAGGREEAAFAALVQRHGPLVLGVCRRVLRDEHHAEDAFQATFLVLARKAASLCWRASISPWLYEVAHRIAMKARTNLNLQRRRERPPQAPAGPAQEPNLRSRELCALLDEELQRLPEKFRMPLLLCCLEGLSRDEAAQRLGWTAGAVKGRLERGRELLRKKLARRGLMFSGALLAMLLSQKTAAAVPVSLCQTTVAAACSIAAGKAVTAVLSANVAALTEGVLKAMFMTKLKMCAVVLLALGMAGTGAGWLTHQAFGQKPATKEAADREKPERERPREGDKERPREGIRGEKEPEIAGIVKEFDAATRALTVRLGENRGEATATLAKDAKVLIDGGKEGKPADLVEGIRVAVFLSADQKSAIRVVAEGPTDRGVVAAVDTAGNAISLGGERERTFPVARDAKIVLDGKAAKLADIKAGLRVALQLSVDKKTVLAVTTGEERRREGGDERRREEGRVAQGVLKAVDAAKKTITLTIQRDAGDEELTLAVGKAVSVSVAGKEGAAVADLKPGMRVAVTLSEDRKTATSVSEVRAREGRERPTVRGVVKSTDAEKSTITVTVQRDEQQSADQTFELSKEARIAVVGKERGTLADLKPGMRITLTLAPDRKTVIGIREIREEGKER